MGQRYFCCGLSLCVCCACLQPTNLHRNGTALVNNAWQTSRPGHRHRGLISRQQLLLCLALLPSPKWVSLLHHTARR